MSHIFISYSRSDSQYASALAQELTNLGFNVWIDLERLETGARWWQEVVDAINECAAFLVIMTPDSKESKWVQRELAIADDQNKPMSPLLLAGNHWERLILEQYLDVTAGDLPKGRFFERLGTFVPRQRFGINVIAREEVSDNYEHPSRVETQIGAVSPADFFGEEIVIRPTDSGFAKGSYTGRNEFRSFSGSMGWTVYYKITSAQRSQVWAQWSPSLARSGKYEVAAFIPSRHATTPRARYKIHGVKDSATEVVIEVDQSRYFNQWVPLGVYEFDRAAVNAGAVFLNDLTYDKNCEITFDTLRWREILEGNENRSQEALADGYDSPVGTLLERRSGKIWPGAWIDLTSYSQLYLFGTENEAYHTGVDLILPEEAARHVPVYAVADGVVTCAKRLPVWGNVIVIQHDPLAANGQVLYSRYAHVEDIKRRVGQRVHRGEQIARVGNGSGLYPYHLHFDLSCTDILSHTPQHWPGLDLDQVLKNYIDPRLFIDQNRP